MAHQRAGSLQRIAGRAAPDKKTANEHFEKAASHGHQEYEHGRMVDE
jgi:hypothetical protein